VFQWKGFLEGEVSGKKGLGGHAGLTVFEEEGGWKNRLPYAAGLIRERRGGRNDNEKGSPLYRTSRPEGGVGKGKLTECTVADNHISTP